MIKGLRIIVFKIVAAIRTAFDHCVEILWWLWHRPSLSDRLLSFDFLPFRDALWHVDPDAGRSVLLTADVADNGLGSFIVVSRHIIF